MRSHVNYSKAQVQIQQMAFVLVALMIFFGMVLLVYFSIRMNSLEKNAYSGREEESLELSKVLASTPELKWTASRCAQCIDLDKALILKEKKSYSGFWSMGYIAIERIYPLSAKKECSKSNYPDCSTITLVNESKDYGAPKGSFVSLCRQETASESYVKCELGKIYVAPRAVK
jgi:hypothetical protein